MICIRCLFGLHSTIGIPGRDAFPFTNTYDIFMSTTEFHNEMGRCRNREYDLIACYAQLHKHRDSISR